MAVTRSKAAERLQDAYRPQLRPSGLASEAAWLVAVAILIAIGLLLVYQAKSQGFAEIQEGVRTKRVVNLNELSSREDLLPYLSMFTDIPVRQFVARRIYYVSGTLPNVGALGHLRVSRPELRGLRGATAFENRFNELGQSAPDASISLLTGEELRLLKSQFVVRRPTQFRLTLLMWSALFLLSFFALSWWWGARAFNGDRILMVPIFLLTGAGLILMVSLRDPLRDSMIFAGFAQGVLGGCVLVALLSLVDYRRAFGNLSFVPLIGSFVLSLLLLVFGYGPGASDAKVNLFGFQPVEVIRLLLVFFLAGYFAQRWEILRHARETRPTVAWLTKYADLPPLEYTIPALVSVALSLVFFFMQKDLGPALVFSCLFLTLYAVARNAVLLAVTGFTILIAGFAAGYVAGIPQNVAGRVAMWLSPWNNVARGGDQLAHSLWSFATGGILGTGLGLGDPALTPAAHTDLIFSALGEEWGYLGVLAIFALYAIFLYRALRIALRAATGYDFFLATGLATSIGLQVILIAAGALGLLPLAGVVTPFLSFGRTSMLVNFVVVAILLSISRSSGPCEGTPLHRPVKVLGLALAACGVLILGKAFYVQVLRSDPIMGEGTLVVQADGSRRFQYNPRFLEIMREIPKGAVYDRNGLPLATSRWDELEAHRADYAELGIDIDRACSRSDTRHYPLGSVTFYLLGDLRTRFRWAAPNSSFVERDSARRLRGYDDRPTVVDVRNPKTGATERTIRYDYRELVPLLRHRYEPDHTSVRRILDRPRDVRMSVDARLQVRVAKLLEQQLRESGKQSGAVVLVDPATGDLLASVSYPMPTFAASEKDDTLYLDLARYGLYPPGSTFKLVTAIAALRKNPGLAAAKYSCVRLPGNRVGAYIKGSRHPIRDDVLDKTPHGNIDMERAMVVSCNAYFAQLGTYDVGAPKLLETANLFGLAAAAPNTAAQLRRSLSQASYGQGQVVASPFQMARVAATIGNNGKAPIGRWIIDENNDRTGEPKSVLDPEATGLLAKYMREVVASGTGRRAGAAVEPIAGKTGTAELANAPSHAWFVGFAPYGKSGARRVAFSILIENGRYGGSYADLGAKIVGTAHDLGLAGDTENQQ